MVEELIKAVYEGQVSIVNLWNQRIERAIVERKRSVAQGMGDVDISMNRMDVFIGIAASPTRELATIPNQNNLASSIINRSTWISGFPRPDGSYSAIPPKSWLSGRTWGAEFEDFSIAMHRRRLCKMAKAMAEAKYLIPSTRLGSPEHFSQRKEYSWCRAGEMNIPDGIYRGQRLGQRNNHL